MKCTNWSTYIHSITSSQMPSFLLFTSLRIQTKSLYSLNFTLYSSLCTLHSSFPALHSLLFTRYFFSCWHFYTCPSDENENEKQPAFFCFLFFEIFIRFLIYWFVTYRNVPYFTVLNSVLDMQKDRLIRYHSLKRLHIKRYDS